MGRCLQSKVSHEVTLKPAASTAVSPDDREEVEVHLHIASRGHEQLGLWSRGSTQHGHYLPQERPGRVSAQEGGAVCHRPTVQVHPSLSLCCSTEGVSKAGLRARGRGDTGEDTREAGIVMAGRAAVFPGAQYTSVQ